MVNDMCYFIVRSTSNLVSRSTVCMSLAYFVENCKSLEFLRQVVDGSCRLTSGAFTCRANTTKATTSSVIVVWPSQFKRRNDQRLLLVFGALHPAFELGERL